VQLYIGGNKRPSLCSQVVGKKKKSEQSDKQTNSFDKLVAKLKDMHPEASQ